MILPKGYKLLECIESTGTQYIDTGFTPDNNTKVIMDAELVDGSASYPAIFGCGETGEYFYVFALNDTSWAGDYISTRYTVSASKTGQHRFVLDALDGVFSVDGVSTTFSSSTLQGSDHIYLCCIKRPTMTGNMANAKVYGCQIYDNGTLIRQYAPCINPDGEVGLYDVVEGKFYGNAGTGSFVAGDELLEVEYIESSGTQYIDTGFVPNQDSKVVLDFQQEGDGIGIFGSRTKYKSNAFTFLWGSNSYWASAYGTNAGVSSVSGDTNRHTIIKDKGDTYLDGSLLISITSNDFTCPHSAYLFCYYDGSLSTGVSTIATGKVYSCQIYDNGTLIRHYIPMVTGGGVAGLYDLVNNTFSTDAAGGNFFAGPRIVELPEGYTQVEYIESSGTQYINTGFLPNQNTRVIMDIDLTAQSAQSLLFGARSAYASNDFSLFTYNNNNGYQDHYGTQVTNVTGTTSSGRHLLDKNKNVTYVDGTAIKTNTATTFSCPYPLFLLAANNGGTPMSVSSYPTKGKLYSCQIYDNGTLVRDLIPCKDSSEAGGLYDLVNGVFYANAGTGTFTVGAVVDAESQIPDGDETTLSAPANFRAEYVTDSEVSLAWDEVEAATGYKLYRNLALISDQTETEYTDTGLAQFASYQYYVVAYNEEEQSAPATLLVNTALADLALALVTDRTQADVSRVKSLASRWMDGTITDEEKAEYLSFMMKGAYNFTDLNRVERAVEYINDTINSIQADVNAALREHNVASDAFWAVPFAQLILEVKKNWAIADLPTESDLARYLDNVVQTTDRIGIEKNLPDSAANGLTYDGANEIEKALLAEFNAGVSYRENMKQLVSNTAKAFVQCGEIYGGEF